MSTFLHCCVFSAFNTFITVALLCQTKTFFKRKGMRCFSTILITAVSVCAALESRRYCDSCSLLKILTRGFYSFPFFFPPTASAQLGTMIDGRGATVKWCDRIHPAQTAGEASEKLGPQNHNLTAVRVENIEKCLCFCPRIEFKSEFQVYKKSSEFFKNMKANWVETFLHISDILCRKEKNGLWL